jgi:hypothetical protein
MTRRLILLGLLPLVLCACGGDDEADRQSPATTAEAPAVTQAVAYYLRSGRVTPARVTVPVKPSAETSAFARAALAVLSGEPPAGVSTDVAGTDDIDVRIDGRVARPDWGGQTLSHAAAAQVVYTLTRLPGVGAVELPGGKEARRSDFEDVTPPILIETPVGGDSVRRAVRVAGTASVYEATLVVELVQDGDVLQRRTVTASTGAPYRGTFSATLESPATGGAMSVVAFSPSAADGSEQHRVEVPIVSG